MKFAYRSFLILVAIMVWDISLSHAGIYNVSTASQLQSALSSAVAGDEIVLKDGIYTGQFTISGNNGTANALITVRAENRHKAILERTVGCSDSGAIDVYRNHWTIKDLRFRNQNSVIRIMANVKNITIQNNIMENFGRDGVRTFTGAANLLIERNVISHGATCTGSSEGSGIVFINSGGTNGVDNSIIRNNIIFATGDNGYQYGSKHGYGILIANNSDDNLIQGNLLLANTGKGVLRLLAGSTVGADRNMVSDNAVLHGEGGGVTTSDCADDSNQFVNNIIYGNYHGSWGTKGNVDGKKGHHNLQHNLIFNTEFTRLGVATGAAGCGGAKVGNVFKNNVVYQSYQPSTNHVLMYIDDEFVTLPSSLNPGYNVFYAPGSTSSWFRNYTLRLKDIAAKPIFVNPAEGDFSLAPGSPGKGAASDGKDIGIEYNEYLKKSWLKNAFALPTQQKDNLGTSASFAVNPNKYYQVWFYIPEPACGCMETFNVEGQSLQRDIKGLTTGSIWVQPGGTQRWITLGRHRATDGTLNISWSNTNSASKIFIRELPTPDAAYQWIPQSDDPIQPLPAPQNLRVEATP